MSFSLFFLKKKLFFTLNDRNNILENIYKHLKNLNRIKISEYNFDNAVVFLKSDNVSVLNIFLLTLRANWIRTHARKKSAQSRMLNQYSNHSTVNACL